MSLPSLREILALPAFAEAELLTGQSRLDEPVTWVHVSELLDAWRFLSGGELLVGTGLELARVTPEAREAYLRSLVEAGAQGLVLELVQWLQGSARRHASVGPTHGVPAGRVSGRSAVRGSHQGCSPPHSGPGRSLGRRAHAGCPARFADRDREERPLRRRAVGADPGPAHPPSRHSARHPGSPVRGQVQHRRDGADDWACAGRRSTTVSNS